MQAKPFLKWVGGKGALAPVVIAALEAAGADFAAPGVRYHEPFLGGGAVFFALRGRHGKNFRARLTDANLEVANAFRAIRDVPEEVAAIARTWPVDRKTFEGLAREFRGFAPRHRAWSAARTIYLNKTCFNGLYRVGPDGFNVPFGAPANRQQTIRVLDEDNLEACSLALSGASIDGEPIASFDPATVARGDVVYLDPPYLGTFSGYCGDFSWPEHELLAELFFALADAGAVVALSNSDTPWVRDAYRKARLHEVLGRRSVSKDPEGRGSVAELLVVAGPGVAPGVAPVPTLAPQEEEARPTSSPVSVRESLGLHVDVRVGWVAPLEAWAIHPGRYSPTTEVVLVTEHQLSSPCLVDQIRRDVLRNKL